MMQKGNTDFCISCRKETEYVLQRQRIRKTVRDREYPFDITVAVCKECGEEMSPPGLMDHNVQEIDTQYRMAEGLISVEDIGKLMKLYNIGKAPLSLALGFGEVTVARYLAGQVPSREYSDIMKRALTSPGYMRQLLEANREKIAAPAYQKAMTAASGLERLFCVSPKLRMAIAGIFERLEEVTPLMLQKLLYFIQGLSLALYDAPFFEEDCEAWVHGPVYVKVYDLFRDFQYNPIDDARFAFFDGNTDGLTAQERQVIALVTDTFGMYGGKVLEQITHQEAPWILARDGYGDGIPSHRVLSKQSIKQYYDTVHQNWDMSSRDGLLRYIHHMLAVS